MRQRLEALFDITAQAGAACQYDKKPRQAAAAFQAGLIFAQRLWTRGLYVPERTVGLNGMETALEGMAPLYARGPLKNPDREQDIVSLRQHVNAALSLWQAKYQIVHSLSPNAADMVNIIRHDRDVSWRIAALSSLGVARWATGDANQARAMLNLLKRKSRSRNKWISKAAKQAAGFTRETINSLSY